MSGPESGLHRASATQQLAALKRGDCSAVELVETAISRIDALEGDLRAFVTIDREGALRAAMAEDEKSTRSTLGGLPVVFKDLASTRGMRTTFGSAVFRDHVPERDDLCVARVRADGGVILGKTNTPEFGYGAVCANPVQGPTANPYDITRASGGSSGGTAVAVCCGMASLGHGTDFGGSCRIPASLSGVVGLRPTAGRVAAPEKPLLWDDLNVNGCLARTVEDVALLLSSMSGPDLADPTSLRAGGPMPVPAFSPEPIDGMRVAFKDDLDVSPLDSQVRSVVAAAIAKVGKIYPHTEEACPDTSGAMDTFMGMRGPILLRTLGHLLADHRDDLTRTVIWNIEKGLDRSAEDYLLAEQGRGRVYRSFAEFFGKYDILMSATTPIAAFPNDQADVLLIDGRPMESILHYMALTSVVSVIGLPAISIPCGTTPDGLPVGLQLIGRPFEEAGLLQFAYTLQEQLGFRHAWPNIVAN